MCGEKKSSKSLKNDGVQVRFSEMGIDTTRGGIPKFVSRPLSHSSPLPNRRFNVGGHPRQAFIYFICTRFVCRALPRFPLLGLDERAGKRNEGEGEGRKGEREGLPKVENATPGPGEG